MDDDIDESSEDFTVKLSNPSSNVWLTDASATGTIKDDDARMEALISRQTKRVDENEGSVVFAVDLVHEDTVGRRARHEALLDGHAGHRHRGRGLREALRSGMGHS